MCFPSSFTINYSNGTQWVPVQTYNSYPTPFRGDWLILPLPGTYTANGIQIVANALSADNFGNYYFQLAEVTAGYDAGFSQFRYLHNDATLVGANHIAGVGPNPFNPNRLSHWDYDDRGVVLGPNSSGFPFNMNIYAPQAVATNGGWLVYFGGWDGSVDKHDRISVSFTADFLTFGAHAVAIDNGSFDHCNNESVLKLGPTNWRMVYTTLPFGNPLNKPAYATSTDGIHWTPAGGNNSYMLRMSNYYKDWDTKADINGGNTIFRDASGIWHLYFSDLSNNNTGVPVGVYHATSTDAINFTNQAKALNANVIPNDFKAFTYGGTTYYVGAFHYNDQIVRLSVGTSLTSIGPLSVAFNATGAPDLYITSAGLVQDGTRLYGILYGAGPDPSLTQNRIFARWLQKKVIFKNSSVQWGDSEHGFGPHAIRLFLAANDNVETGNFYVYDSDGTTLLYTSPTVTMRSGDVWQYSGP